MLEKNKHLKIYEYELQYQLNKLQMNMIIPTLISFTLLISCVNTDLSQESLPRVFSKFSFKSHERSVDEIAMIDRKRYTKHRARITYYTPYEDKWGAQVADPKTKRAKEGITIAAHPEFKFGTKIYIPNLKDKVGDGWFVVQDRGSAVTSKKASNGKAYVFDVFLSTGKKLHNHKTNRKMYMDVYVEKEQ